MKVTKLVYIRNYLNYPSMPYMHFSVLAVTVIQLHTSFYLELFCCVHLPKHTDCAEIGHMCTQYMY